MVETQIHLSPPAAALEPAPRPAPRPYLTLRPSRGWTALNLREMWEFRDLLWTLASRDLKLRYKQTALGVVWVILQPLMAAGVFSFVFQGIAHLPSDGVPPVVFAFAGLLGWNFFSSILSKVSGCLIGNQQLISKVYFPRLVLPLSSVGSSAVDFLAAGAMMGVLLGLYRIPPSPFLLLLPLWLLMLAAVALGLGLWTAALTVSYRDVQYIMPVVLNILLYASPVGYSLASALARVDPRTRWVLLLNPLTPPLEAMRASLLGRAMPPVWMLASSAAVAAVLLVVGLFAFKRMERNFADVI